ncbi:MAG: glutathione S-transferase C-terminal domain-containing protein [Propionibacteriaceae bacterium]|jgi:putative glutathione S-transferase|nr:glutathione S-transferase C-terminal domain-containing protein [Propionibacteriaceae bacterium]
MTAPTLPGPPPTAEPVDFETYSNYGDPSAPSRGGLFRHSAQGDTIRPPYPIQGRIRAGAPEPGADRSADPAHTTGAQLAGQFPAAPDRYVLYVSLACPWAQRQLIVRQLKGLQEVIAVAVVDPIRDARGWAFRPGRGLTLDPYNHFTFLSQAYNATIPDFPGHVSVPVLWDTTTRQIVSNNFPDISLDLGSEFDQWAANPGLDLYPADLRGEIDALNDRIYRTVNNGVYQAGGATTQQAYDRAVTALFETLDDLESRLGDNRHLFGDRLTEADIRLWVTLARFDAVYATHFKTNRRRLVDYPNLWDYARRLYQQPAFHETTDFDQIKRHYFITHAHLNPHRIVPIGFEADWTAPTRR